MNLPNLNPSKVLILHITGGQKVPHLAAVQAAPLLEESLPLLRRQAGPPPRPRLLIEQSGGADFTCCRDMVRALPVLGSSERRTDWNSGAMGSLAMLTGLPVLSQHLVHLDGDIDQVWEDLYSRVVPHWVGDPTEECISERLLVQVTLGCQS